MESLQIFHEFLDIQNHVFYCKTNGLDNFRLFAKIIKSRRFYHPFWYYFERLLASLFFDLWASILECVFLLHFKGFWTENGAEVVTQIRPKSSKNIYVCTWASFWWILGRFLFCRIWTRIYNSFSSKLPGIPETFLVFLVSYLVYMSSFFVFLRASYSSIKLHDI